MADISKITVPINGTDTTFDIKALKSLSVPIATVDSTSTSTAFTVQVPEFTNEPELRDGLFFFIYNNKVASASGWTLKVNDFDAKPVYNASAERTTTGFAKTRFFPIWYNSTLISGGCWIIGYLTDANTTYGTFTNLALGSAGYLADSPVYRYQLLFQIDDFTVTPLNNNSNATGTGKTMLTDVEFDPFGDIFYYATTGTVNANARVNGSYMCYAYGALDLRYTFNCGQTLTAYAPVYLKVSLQSNGKVKIADSTPWEQILPSTNDGYYYIYLGRTYSTYQMTLEKDHPIFYHDGNGIKEYINPNIAIEDSDTHRPIQVNGTEVLGDNTTALNLIPGSNVSITNGSSGITIAATDTTYSSKTAASGGTDVSLVTTGEKYTWNNKGSGTITGIKMNGASKGTSGVVDLGTVITAHQDISGKLDVSLKGAAEGLAELDSNGTVPINQLPSYAELLDRVLMLEAVMPLNVASGVTWIDGKYYDNNGAVKNSSNTKLEEVFLSVSPDTSYKITIIDSSGNRLRIHEYKSDQSWIRQSVNTTEKTATWTTHANAAYLRLSVPVNTTAVGIFKA